MNPFRWRKMSWLIIVFTVIMGIWIAGAVGSETECPPNVVNCAAYQSGADVGRGLAVVVLFFIWLIGFLVLAVLWFMTRGRHRACPVCGNDVKKGRSVCKKCGYDFAAQMRMQGS